ncbi:hypothetical protein BX600DRAFT_516965 [Xylariales sp. PMI_506]|nr:hypothetical protein BX600DRAFT_516965 [Xylariales sp. PMI_506]
MRAFTATSLAAVIGVATAQATFNSTTGQWHCPIADGAYCASSSLMSSLIVRCTNGVGQLGNCNDNLAGEPPVGVNYAPCWETSITSGDAACSKDCIVYGDSGNANGTFTLPNCTPTATASKSYSASSVSSTSARNTYSASSHGSHSSSSRGGYSSSSHGGYSSSSRGGYSTSSHDSHSTRSHGSYSASPSSSHSGHSTRSHGSYSASPSGSHGGHSTRSHGSYSVSSSSSPYCNSTTTASSHSATTTTTGSTSYLSTHPTTKGTATGTGSSGPSGTNVVVVTGSGVANRVGGAFAIVLAAAAYII